MLLIYISVFIREKLFSKLPLLALSPTVMLRVLHIFRYH
jgi:hypothetical protein